MDPMALELYVDLTTEVDKLKANCLCLQCKKTLKKPVNIRLCKHILCAKCVPRGTKKCPICKTNFHYSMVTDDKFTQKVVEAYEHLQSLLSEQKKLHPDIVLQIWNFPVVPYTNMKKDYRGEIQLHKACKRGNLKAVNNFILTKVNLNEKDHAGWAPMHEAVIADNKKCVEKLLKAGAFPNIRGEYYKTPLHKAVEHNLPHIVQLLLKYGAKPYLLDYSGHSPLNLAAANLVDIFKNTDHEFKHMPNIYIKSMVTVFAWNVSSNANQILRGCKSIAKVALKDFVDGNDVTHMVIGDKEEISLYFLIAILKGIFVVRENWSCIDLPENWIMSTLPCIPADYKAVVMQAAENALLQNPPLFDGMNFYFIDYELKTHKIYELELKKEDLLSLVKIGGGKVLARAPALRTVEDHYFYPFHINRSSALTRCAHYIIYMEEQQQQLRYNMKELQHKPSKWIVDCILNFKILP